MSKRCLVTMVALGVLAAGSGLAPASATEAGNETLADLFGEWREFQKPRYRDGVPDYTTAAMAEQHRLLSEWQARLSAIDVSAWSVEEQIDHHLVRAEMNGLDFDHRVLRPWARNPSYYTVLIESQSDTPRREGSVMDGGIELWRMASPPSAEDAAVLGARLAAIPAVYEQARGNLGGEARDLWLVGIRTQRDQAEALGRLGSVLGESHPSLVAAAARARDAAQAFVGWLEVELPKKTAASGVGIENYDWYLKNVHLLPYTWEDELRLMERELARSVGHLALEEHRNRALAPLQPAASAEEWQRSAGAAIETFLAFLDQKQVMTMTADMEPALRERVARYLPPGDRHFFAQVDMREPLLMRCHHVHWFDLARMKNAPHASPIRRVPLLYNIWDSRAEGLATGMEELMTSAGLLDDRPRGRELTYIMLAQRAARAIAGLRMHSNEWSIEQAMRFAHENTPRGWLKLDGDLVWGEQQLYLEQPGYGTSYVTGKAMIDALLAEQARRLGDAFTLKGFMDEFLAAGVIPVSLIRWQMTGTKDPSLEPAPRPKG